MRRYAIILIGITGFIFLMQFLSCGKKEDAKKPGITATFEVQEGFTTWEKVYGAEQKKLIGMDVGMTPDGGYFIVGNSGWSRDNEKIYMLKLDSLGIKIWDKALGKSYSVWARNFVPAFDDGYVILSQGIKGEEDEKLINITKVNSSGKYQWDRVLDIGGEDACGDIGRTVDSNYIVTGNTASIEAGGIGIFLAKVDRSGKIIWKKNYFDLKAQGGSSLMVENDGYLIIGKITQTEPHANDDMVIMKTDTAGNILWLKNMGGSGNEKAFAFNKTDDGGYVVAGTYNNADNHNIDDIYIVSRRDIQ